MEKSQYSILKYAFSASPLVLMGVGYILLERIHVDHIPRGDSLPVLLAALAAGCVFFSGQVACLLSRQASRANPEAEERLRFLFDLAFRDTAAVLGLVLSILTGELAWVLGLGIVSFLGILNIDLPDESGSRRE